MTFRITLLAAVASLGMIAAANAAPFTGTLTLTANVITEPTTVTVNNATGLNFVGATGADNGSAPGTVLNFGGSNLASGTGGTINDIANFSTYTTGTLFTLSNGLTFTLNAPLTVTGTAATGSSLATLAVGGTGVFSGDGFDATNGIFTITTQGTNATFNLASGSGVATATPEPASLALLGGGLAALGLIRRRRA